MVEIAYRELIPIPPLAVLILPTPLNVPPAPPLTVPPENINSCEIKGIPKRFTSPIPPLTLTVLPAIDCKTSPPEPPEINALELLLSITALSISERLKPAAPAELLFVAIAPLPPKYSEDSDKKVFNADKYPAISLGPPTKL
jgi:hypothetical protein